MAYQPVYPHPPPLLDTPAECIGNIFYFYFLSPFSSPYPRPHHGCMLCHELHLLHLTPQKKERKKHPQFLTKCIYFHQTPLAHFLLFSTVLLPGLQELNRVLYYLKIPNPYASPYLAKASQLFLLMICLLPAQTPSMEIINS